jgi:hypothetical protein
MYYTLQRVTAIKKEGSGDTINTKLINNGILKSPSDNVCSAIDSLKRRMLPEGGPVWLKRVVK